MINYFSKYVYKLLFAFPTIRFSLILVPCGGCVDGAADRNRVCAAPSGTSPEECESKPDRCYWSEGWSSSKGAVARLDYV